MNDRAHALREPRATLTPDSEALGVPGPGAATPRAGSQHDRPLGRQLDVDSGGVDSPTSQVENQGVITGWTAYERRKAELRERLA